ncbi:hypothetical protein Tco_0184633 [Tanacetum coccineum]
MGKGSANPTDPHHTPTIIQPTTQPQKIQKPRKPKRKDTQVPQPSDPSDNVTDEAIHKELGNSLVRAATTASSLKAEQDSGNITKTRSKATPNESSSLRTTSGGGLRCQETMRDTISQTRFKNVLDLEKTKTTQANDIASLKRRVKKLEKKRSSRTHKLKRLYKGRINAIDADEDITLVNVQDDVDKEMYDVGTVTGDEVFAEQEVAAKDVNLTVDEVTLAQALEALKSVKPKVKGVVIEEPNVPVNAASASTNVSAATTTTATIPTPRKGIFITELGTPTITRSSQQPSQAKVQDKGKGKMIEPEPAKIEAAHELAQRLQAEEQEELREEEQTTNLSLTKKNHIKDLKNKSFDSIQKMFDRAFKRVNTFVDFRTYLVEGSSKMYLVFSQLLKSVDKEDLVELYKLVKDKYGSTRPLEDMDLLLWGDLKTMFEPHVEDEIWKLQQRMRIEQYIQMIDYALWEVIENGATLQKTQVVEGATTVMPITSAEDKERIPKKKTKNEAKTTKPDTEWKSVEKDKVKSKPKCRKVNPSQPRSQKSRKTSLGTKLVKSLNLS